MPVRKLFVLALLAACATTSQPTPEAAVTEAAPSILPADLDTPLPTYSEMRTGELDNGLNYYIIRNDFPENRASLRLILDAGSVLEDEDQLGLAHFMEHMAFNGTEHFPGNQLVTYLESVGTKFGAHLNAHTSFDETIYKLLVPTDDAEQFDKSLVVLRDWAGGVLLDPEEVDKERGVVLEEWRGSSVGMQKRMTDAMVPNTFYGSPHAERLPIGTEESLKTFDHAALERFYKDWYRPDLMAVAVVGAVDVDATEARIKELFGDLKNPENERERKRYRLPSHEETLVSVLADPEMPASAITLMAKHDAEESDTYAELRDDMVLQIGVAVLNERLTFASQQADRKFLQAFAGTQPLAPMEAADVLTGATMPGTELDALEAMLTEAERIKRFGITEAELDRAKANMRTALEAQLKEKDRLHSRSGVEELVRVHLHGEFIMGTEAEVATKQALLDTIGVDQVSALVSQRFLPSTGRVLNVVMPEKEGLEVPSDEAVRAVLEKVQNSALVPPSPEVPSGPLLETVPEAGTITARRAIPDGLGAEEWTLSNGMKVWVKKTDFQKDQVRFELYSPGGSALVSDEDYYSAASATSISAYSGLGNHDASQLRRLLTGKRLSVSANIAQKYESVSGWSSPDDLETAFQVAYLQMTEPRFTEDGMALYQQASKVNLENRDMTPDTAFRDQVEAITWQNHPRHQPWTLETLEQVTLEQAEATYQARFADGDDFTAMIVGNYDNDELERLVTTYLASLPTLETAETNGDDGARRAEGTIREVIRSGHDPKAQVTVSFHGPIEAVDLETDHLMESMAEVMRVRLREVIREELGGTYGVGANVRLMRTPEPNYVASVSFGCDPERAEELTKAMHQTLESLRTTPVEDSYVAQVQEKQRRSWEDAQKNNGTWLSMMREVAIWSIDPAALTNPTPRIDGLTAEKLQAGFAKYLDEGSMLEFTWLPEEE